MALHTCQLASYPFCQWGARGKWKAGERTHSSCLFIVAADAAWTSAVSLAEAAGLILQCLLAPPEPAPPNPSSRGTIGWTALPPQRSESTLRGLYSEFLRIFRIPSSLTASTHLTRAPRSIFPSHTSLQHCPVILGDTLQKSQTHDV